MESKKKEIEFVLNPYGFKVCKKCVACRYFGAYTSNGGWQEGVRDDNGFGTCLVHGDKTHKRRVCENFAMKSTLAEIGSGGEGRIHTAEWVKYLSEHLADVTTTVDKQFGAQSDYLNYLIREFEKVNGSRYMDNF